MTDWPRMESKVTINRAFFFSAYFIENYSTDTREKMSELEGKELTVCGMGIFRIDRRCDVTPDGNVVYSVPLEFLESTDETTDEAEKAHAESVPGGKTVLTEEEFEKRCPNGSPLEKDKAEVVSFGFTNNIFLDDAILFFARNGYKAWVEEEFGVIYTTQRLMVEKPKEER